MRPYSDLTLVQCSPYHCSHWLSPHRTYSAIALFTTQTEHYMSHTRHCTYPQAHTLQEIGSSCHERVTLEGSMALAGPTSQRSSILLGSQVRRAV